MLASIAIQNNVNTLEKRVQTGFHDDGITKADEQQMSIWTNDLVSKQAELVKALEDEALQRERIDAQTEKIETITLAYDYNEILGNPLANETIIENVKQFQQQAYEEHNTEVARINSEWSEKVKTGQEEYSDLLGRHKKQADYLNEIEVELEEKKEDNYRQHEQINQLAFEKREAEATRDNAVRLLEEAKEEVEKHKQSTLENCELRKEIEDLKQELIAKKAITVSGNEKLAELAAKAKESTAAAAQRGIERWNKEYGMDIPVLEVPEIQPVNAVLEEEATTKDESFRESDQVDATESGLADQSQTEDGESPEESEVITLESLHERVKALELKVAA